MGDKPPAGDAGVPLGPEQIPASTFTPYMGGGYLAGSGGGLFTGGGVLPPVTVSGDGRTGTTTARGQEAVVGGGPVSGFYEGGQGAPGAPAGAKDIATGPKTDGVAPGAQDAANEILKPKLTFETDKTKANAYIDDKGAFSWKDSKVPGKGEDVKLYVDPKFSGAKDPKAISDIVDKANADLKAKGIKMEIQKPADMTAAVKAHTDQQAKVKPEKKEHQRREEPNGGGGGGGGGGDAPDRKEHKKNTEKNKKSKDATETVPKTFENTSAEIDKKGGVNKAANADLIKAAYDKIPGFNDGAGSLMSQYADIDNDPNLTPEQKAAKKAELMAKFQKDHEKEIKENVGKYGKESGDSFLRDQDKAGFDSIANNLADPSKAGAIVDMLSNNGKASDASVKAVFDEKGQTALKNLALVEGASWKDASDEDIKKQAKLATDLVTEGFKFSRL